MKRRAGVRIATTFGWGTFAAGCLLEDNPDWIAAAASTGDPMPTSTDDDGGVGSDAGSTGTDDGETTFDGSTGTDGSDDESSEGDVDSGEAGDVCPWSGVEFSHRSLLTIAGRDVRSNFAGFAVMVRLTPERFAYAAAASDGADLRFFDEAGNALPFEFDTWSADDTSIVWVRLSDLQQGESSSFWMCYGASAAPDAPEPTSVWDADDRGVWHLGGLNDSTAHGNDAVNAGTVDGEGLVGAARSFAGTGERLEVPNAASLQISGSITVSALVRYASFDDDPNSNTILVHGGANDGSADNVLYRFEYEPSDLGADAGLWLTWQWGNQNDSLVKSPSVPLLQTGTWHHLAAVRNTDDDTVSFYADGQAIGAPKAYSGDPSGGSEGALMIGANPTSPAALNFAGEIDEVRVSAAARSADHIALEFASISDNLLDYGPVETNP